MTQQQPHSASGRPGRMTAVMRAVSQTAGPKILRIGVVQGGKVIDERLIKQRVSVTIGPSEKAMFVVPTRKIPPNFRLFELIGTDYYLNYIDGMTGRVALKTGISDLATLKTQAKTVTAGGVTFNRVRLTEDARGKVEVGETKFLFQFVVPPPVQPKPQLPVSVQKGMAGDIDWFTTIVASFSFLIHFFFVALVYSDWMDPIVDDDYALVRLQERAKNIPTPPAPDVAKAPETDSTAASTSDAKEEGPQKATAAKATGKGTGKAQGDTGKASTGGNSAENDAKAAELAATLAEFDVQTLGAMGGGVAVEGVMGSSDVPTGLLDEAGRSAMGSGTGGPDGLKLAGNGTRSVGPPGQGGTGSLKDIGKEGAADGPGGGAESAGTAKAVKGPTGNVSVGGAGVAGGAVSNASSVVARMKGRFRACYNSGLQSNPELQGSVMLVAKIGPNGGVQGVGGGGGALGPIVGCLKGVVASGGFSPPDNGVGATVSIPITFILQK